jgi:hypothetical protein
MGNSVNFVVKERMDERRETKLGIDPASPKELDLKQMDSAAGQEGRGGAAKTNAETVGESLMDIDFGTGGKVNG